MARDARAYIDELDKAAVTQAIMSDAGQVAAIRVYVDDLRCKFPDVTDSDLGWLIQWVSGFVLAAQQQHGQKVTAESMMMTFALMSRELLLLEAAPGAPDDSGA